MATNLLVFQLDRQEQYIRRENILIYGVEENKEDNDDGEKVLFKLADGLEIYREDNEIQRVHQLGKKEETMRIHKQSLQELCHTKKEMNLLLTNENSKISKEDSTSSFVKISRLCGTSYWSTCKNPVLIRLALATLEMAI